MPPFWGEQETGESQQDSSTVVTQLQIVKKANNLFPRL